MGLDLAWPRPSSTSHVHRHVSPPPYKSNESVGQNPTGGTLSLERRKKIYALCQKYDVLIIEDDPYYFLQMPDYGSTRTENQSESEFLGSLIPSYLRIDTDGRVLRCDSFSKVIAPGSRAGWITAAPVFIERLTRHAEVGTQATSGWAQSFIAKLLIDEWGMQGWIEWLKGLGGEYTKRRDYIVGAMNKEFALDSADDAEESEYVVVSQPKRLISFVPPMAGMFLWIRVALEQHPRYNKRNSVELMDELWKRLAVTEDLLIAPGRMFAASDDQRDEAAKYFRVAFSVGEEDEVDEMVKRFGRAVRWFFKGKT
jgi:aromatic amino acid aminotransferase I